MILVKKALLQVLIAAALMTTGASDAWGQERPAKRVADIVGVALAEYEKGIDAAGRTVSAVEYDEAVSFLERAREAAQRLSGTGADSARLALDSLTAGVSRKMPPAALERWRDAFFAALGADAALDLPTKPVDLAAGSRLYARHCASCHGDRGMGDGEAGRRMVPPPPALGSAALMRDVPPALMYRIVSVGIAGTQMIGWADVLSADDRWSIVSWLNTLRGPDAGGLAAAEGLWLQRCASCHGIGGASNGPMSVSLSRLPPELSSFAWQAERNDTKIAEAIRNGMVGTAMPAARDLTATELDGLVAWVRTLSLADAPGASVGRTDPDSTVRSVMRLLESAMSSARLGRQEEADDQAFDAYIAFEPLETPARARSPGTVAALERHFADFKGAIAAKDLRSAERSMNAIEQGLPAVKDMAGPPASGFAAFLQSLLIILREGFEAILVIGAVVAFLIKTGHRERLRSIWTGVLLALGASALTAIVLATLLRALPATREVIEGATMLVAVAVLFSVSYWLISKVEAARWQRFIREKVDAALQHGGGTALALVAFLAVYREGAETALFYQALLNEGGGIVLPILAGVLVGAGALAVIFTLFWKYGIRIPLRPFFAVTSVLLYYMAFVFMGKGVRELQEGGVMSITVLPGWPHVEAMGIFPSVETLLAQALLLLFFAFALLKTFWPSRSVALPTVPQNGDVMKGVLERLDAIEKRLEAVGARDTGRDP
jgi:high-affinity iron transporter